MSTLHRLVRGAVPVFAVIVLGSEACTHTDALNFAGAEDASTPTKFTNDATVPDGGQTKYCPLLSCPAPYATCPGSRFPCDTNLNNDIYNCGSCGFLCGDPAHEVCNNGHCIPSCDSNEDKRDCNGIVDDGCETTIYTNENCSACGDKCADPAKPCVFVVAAYQCGCNPGNVACGNTCVDLASDDHNCGACDNACDPAGEGDASAPGPNQYYGCHGSTCGHLNCEQGFGDCDANPKNGCETPTNTNANCGACGKSCGPDQQCVDDGFGNLSCLCPPGKTLCQGFLVGETPKCTDILTDPVNCGGCGVSCELGGEGLAATTGVWTCSYGSCKFSCATGFADCNGDLSDACETNIGSDQNNCGACGHGCDVTAGQPCVGGACAVEPCGDAGATR